jgi:hypothetical protein
MRQPRVTEDTTPKTYKLYTEWECVSSQSKVQVRGYQNDSYKGSIELGISYLSHELDIPKTQSDEKIGLEELQDSLINFYKNTPYIKDLSKVAYSKLKPIVISGAELRGDDLFNTLNFMDLIKSNSK